MMRVLVCGGRDFSDGGRVFEVLHGLHKEVPISCIIEGGALGADEWGALWADTMDVQRLKFKADWQAHSLAAGPIRNRRMLVDGKPDLVVAFPGGKGTANMVKQARAAGVKVVEVNKETPIGVFRP